MNIKFAQTVFPIVIVLSIMIKEGLSIKCFDCNNYGNKMCDNPKEGEVEVTDCGEEVKMCRKIEQLIEIDGEEETRVLRQCAPRGELGECLERTGTNKFKSWYCHCNTNLCNTGSPVTSFTGLIFGAALASLVALRNML